MLTIIHGSDIAASRKYFTDEKQQYPEATLLDADQINLSDLAQIFEGGGLFSETKQVFIEQFLTKRKKSSDYKDILTYLNAQEAEHIIILWEGKELEASVFKPFQKPVIKAFKLPQTLFAFLDALKPGNGKTLVKLFHQTIETAETEMVFFMLIRQTRIMLALSRTGHLGGGRMDSREVVGEIDELKRMAPWQRNKLEKQSALFVTKDLLILYDKLYQIEKGQKTGMLNTPLVSAIDFLLVEV